ncbi:MAG: hypothetical protein ACOCP4_02760 [Candidatus Woesearchaeota archaeon]
MFRKIRRFFKRKKYNYCKSHHSEFRSLPKDVKRFIKGEGIENPETKMFDIDIYYDIDIRNSWEKE